MSDTTPLNQRLKELLAKCATGDESALSELYRLTAPNLLAVQVRLLGMNAMAERALHDTFSRIWLKASEYNTSVGEPMPWLTSMARNHALNLKRARRDNNNPDATIVDDTARIDAEFVGLDFLADSSDLKNTFNDIDKVAGESIVRAYLDGASIKELSEIYNRPIDSLHASIHEGMRVLGSAS